MGNTNTRTRTTARRIAAFLALLGALVLSSGVALMATATAADASHKPPPPPTLKDWVCKYVGTPGVNERLKHGNDGLVWVSTSATQGNYFDDGQNRSYVLLKNAPQDPKPDASQCPQPSNDWATADVQWIEPSCENGNQADYATSGDHVTWSVVSGSATPGSWITLKAKATSPYEFEHGDEDTKLFSHKFDKAEVCRDAAASVEVTQPTCDNQNTPGFEPSGSHVTWEVLEQDLTPGGHVTVKFTADAGHEFPDHEKTKTITKNFDDAEDCTQFDATASVEWVEPSCQNQNTPNYLPTGEHVTWEITDGSLTPDGDVEVTATADPGHAFDNEAATKVFTHHFDAAEICEIVNPPREVTPGEPTFVDPTCDTDPSMTLPQQEILAEAPARQVAGPVVGTSDADGIHYEATGDLVPGGTVEVDATLINPETTFFGEGATTHWSHTFVVPEGCTTVSPPTVTTTATEGTTESVVTPTVVEAGLTGQTVEDLRAQQGLALVVAGMVLLVCAGGLGLVRPRR
jgi:hypothetical protein